MSIKASRTAFKSGGSVSDWMLNGHKYILMTRLNQWPQGIGQMDIKYRIQLHFKTENKIWGSSWSWPSCVNPVKSFAPERVQSESRLPE